MRQLEGHEASVLTLSWQGGGQLVTGSSDGLVKVSGELGTTVASVDSLVLQYSESRHY